MSIDVMTLVWKKSDQKGSSLLLLLALADYANETGICWPSIKTLSGKVRMSVRQTTRLIQSLSDSGELSIVEKGGSGPGDSTVYSLNLSLLQSKDDKMTTLQIYKGDNLSDYPRKKGDIKDSAKGDISNKKGDKKANKGAIAMAPKPSLEPSIIESSKDGTIESSIDSTQIPSYYKIFTEIALDNKHAKLKRPLEHCETWLEEKGIDYQLAEEIATAMQAKATWGPARAHYKDIWATFQSWFNYQRRHPRVSDRQRGQRRDSGQGPALDKSLITRQFEDRGW